ncbi:MAG: hypothetical protein VR72_06895 [Clostridiaceae bacterium BRH_c20a]|nr:MAG: hypothetical protein VR72_06895 [Clostridiaceae bacterium BRH_c20a]
MKKKFTIGIVIFLALISVTFYLQKDVAYKELTLSDAPQEIKSQIADIPFSENTSKGMAQIGLKTYAIIIGQSGQQIEIISVEKSEDVGIDILYRIKKLTDSNSERPVKIVSFLNLFGGPVGFKELD